VAPDASSHPAGEDRRMPGHCSVYAVLELFAAAAAGASLAWREQLLSCARQATRHSQLHVLVTEARRVTVRVCLPAALTLVAAAVAALAGGCRGVGDAGAAVGAIALLACPASLPGRGVTIARSQAHR
jgi:hypothetical protein